MGVLICRSRGREGAQELGNLRFRLGGGVKLGGSVCGMPSYPSRIALSLPPCSDGLRLRATDHFPHLHAQPSSPSSSLLCSLPRAACASIVICVSVISSKLEKCLRYQSLSVQK